MSQTGAQGGPAGGQLVECLGSASQPGLAAGPRQAARCQRAHSHVRIAISITAPREHASCLRARRALCPSQTSRQHPAWAAARSPLHAPHGARGLEPAQEGAAAVPSPTGVSERAASSICLLPSRTPRALPPPRPSHPAQGTGPATRPVGDSRASDPLTSAPSHLALGLGGQVREQRAALWKVTA